MGKKKNNETNASVAPEVQTPEALAPETPVPETQTVDTILDGVNIEDTALAGIEGRLAVTMPERLNLREGPSTTHKVVEELQEGTLVVVLALPYEISVPGWVPVHTGERTGWVMSKYIEYMVAAQPEQKPEEE